MKDLKKLFGAVKQAASEGKLGQLVDKTAEDLVQKTMQEVAPLVDKANALAKELGADEALARLKKAFDGKSTAGVEEKTEAAEAAPPVTPPPAPQEEVPPAAPATPKRRRSGSHKPK